MATITAKYAGKCGGCGAAVAAGSKVEWAGRITGCSACGVARGDVSAPRSILSYARKPYYATRAKSSSRECSECGEYVTPGTRCWETGAAH